MKIGFVLVGIFCHLRWNRSYNTYYAEYKCLWRKQNILYEIISGDCISQIVVYLGLDNASLV